jgi:hypothetical protein
MSCLLPPIITLDRSSDIEPSIELVNCAGLKDISTGDFLTYGQLEDAWENNGCPSLFNNYIFQKGKFNKDTFSYSQSLIQNAFYIYFNNKPFEPSIYTAPVLQSQLLDTCQIIPGICALVQNNMCRGCSNDQISSSYNLLSFCGCFTNEDPILPATINRACNNLCTNSISSKDRSNDTGEPIICNQPVCVIDKISLQATNSSLNNINFGQVCNQCASNTSGCQCYIDVSVPNIIEEMGLQGPTLSQNCPFNECFIVDDKTGKVNSVDCSEYNKKDIVIPINNAWYWLLFFLFFIILIGIFSYVFWTKNYHQVSFQLNIEPPIKT